MGGERFFRDFSLLFSHMDMACCQTKKQVTDLYLHTLPYAGTDRIKL